MSALIAALETIRLKERRSKPMPLNVSDEAFADSFSSSLAVVIPIGPGDMSWRELLDDLRSLPEGTEVCLVPCTSNDAAILAASALPAGVRYQLAAQGRAVQQNTGARVTQNHWLWFLHADSRLGAATWQALRSAIPKNSAQAIHYFDLAFHDGGGLMQLNRFGAWLRSRWLSLPFGDQGLLLPRTLFERLGGFDEDCAEGEDHQLIWRARRSGVALNALRAPLYTSARKYSEQGWLTMTVRHVALTWRQARSFSRYRQ